MEKVEEKVEEGWRMLKIVGEGWRRGKKAGESVYSSNSLNENISIVFDLKDVRVSEEIVDERITDGYLNEQLNELFINLIKELKDSAEIKVYSELL